MRHFALFLALAALLVSAACTDGDGVPDSPPGSGDDDGVVGDDDDSVTSITLPLAVSTGSCEVSLSGEDLQVAVSHPEERSDLDWQTPVPPRVTVPEDGGWWRVEVYAIGYTVAETFVRLEGGNAYQSETPDGEESMATSVAIGMHYNFGALCVNAADFGNSQCTPSQGGNRWHVDFTLGDEDDVSVSMGPYNPTEQKVIGIGWSDVEVSGCTLTFNYDEENSFDASVNPDVHEFADEWEDFTGYRL